VGYEDGHPRGNVWSSARRNEPGKTYQYKDPEGRFTRADEAKSKGSFMHRIKGKLTYRKKGRKNG